MSPAVLLELPDVPPLLADDPPGHLRGHHELHMSPRVAPRHLGAATTTPTAAAEVPHFHGTRHSSRPVLKVAGLQAPPVRQVLQDGVDLGHRRNHLSACAGDPDWLVKHADDVLFAHADLGARQFDHFLDLRAPRSNDHRRCIAGHNDHEHTRLLICNLLKTPKLVNDSPASCFLLLDRATDGANLVAQSGRCVSIHRNGNHRAGRVADLAQRSAIFARHHRHGVQRQQRAPWHREVHPVQASSRAQPWATSRSR
mmetsp:Transcript_7213/g.21802  ORF Transcript_7213/g.21802 Transcript_7213/m.21802 type:complete len:255 (-) Transcript_7213:8-772(-)